MSADRLAYPHDLQRLIRSTRRSLDVIVHPAVPALTNPGRENWGATLTEKVRKRAMLFTIASPRLRPASDIETYHRLTEAGWEVHVLFAPPSPGFLLSDDRVAMRVRFWMGSHAGGGVQHELITDSPTVSYLHENFAELWKATGPLEVLYAAGSEFDLVKTAPTIAVVSADVHDRLLQDLRADPRKLYGLDPFEFERLVAEMLRRRGISVHLTPRSNDGGYDILAQQTTPLGRLLYLVECKRWSEANPVGVEIVNALYGVVEQRHATGGMIVTTSRFTRGALRAARTLENRITLTDYSDLQTWLKA